MFEIETPMDLLEIRLGDLFIFHGYQYKAQSDAREHNGFVRIKSCRRELGSNSGFMLADICEFLN
jgi:hypothetical protein